MAQLTIPFSLDVNLDSKNVNILSSEQNLESYYGYDFDSQINMNMDNGIASMNGHLVHEGTLNIRVPDATTVLPIFVPHVSQARNKRAILVSIIGAGGTGGYVVRDFLRFLSSLKGKGDTRNFLVQLVDDDVVEEKNLIRQNFIASDLNKPKALVLAERYGRAFGIPVVPKVQKISSYYNLETLHREGAEMINNNDRNSCLHIVVGCVDNHKARREINSYLNRHTGRYWIDAGNERKSGQVVCGYSISGVTAEPNVAFKMPKVTDLYPEILDESQDLVGSDETSCAERAQQEDQNIFINMTSALNVLNYLRAIILEEKITNNEIRFDIKGLSTPTHLTYDHLREIYGTA